VLVTLSHLWRNCRNQDRENACIRKRISPATKETRAIVRPCDCCPIGTRRARALAANTRRTAALLFATA
jgi:hypothetical protein